LRHSFQHHYWSHLTYKIDYLCTSETFLSTPLLISPDLHDELSLFFWDIPINTTTDFTWSARLTVILLLRHSCTKNIHLLDQVRSIVVLIEMSQNCKDVIIVDQVRSVVVLIWMSQKYKDSPSCRSDEISSGVDRNVSEVQWKFIL
jgi:hypothetical protein